MFPEVDRPGDPPAPPPALDGPAEPTPTLEEIYDAHAERVWRTLRALGVDTSRIDDAVQDVFLVVHRRLGEFEGRSSIATWLYGIARRVAAQHRRRGAGEQHAALDDRAPAPGESPREAAQRREAARLVLELLDELDDDKREVFALCELEQLTAPAVAELLGIPLNTVYSRLRLARQRFEAALARRLPREEP
jgi:RNA polymerase sigma-70 factor (ECF subfamily)